MVNVKREEVAVTEKCIRISVSNEVECCCHVFLADHMFAMESHYTSFLEFYINNVSQGRGVDHNPPPTPHIRWFDSREVSQRKYLQWLRCSSFSVVFF